MVPAQEAYGEETWEQTYIAPWVLENSFLLPGQQQMFCLLKTAEISHSMGALLISIDEKIRGLIQFITCTFVAGILVPKTVFIICFHRERQFG